MTDFDHCDDAFFVVDNVENPKLPLADSVTILAREFLAPLRARIVHKRDTRVVVDHTDRKVPGSAVTGFVTAFALGPPSERGITGRRQASLLLAYILLPAVIRRRRRQAVQDAARVRLASVRIPHPGSK